MAEENEDGQEKTEEPTPRRLEKAREEGQVLSSKEVFVFVGMAAATLMLGAGLSYLPEVSSGWGGYLRFGGPERLDAQIAARAQAALEFCLYAGLLVGLPLMALTLLAQAAIGGGITFAAKAMQPKASKLNPLKGLQRMVSMKALVELAKAVLKVSLLIGAGLVTLIPALPRLDTLVFASVAEAMDVFGGVTVRVLGTLCAGLLAIAAVDLAWQIHSHFKKLRMTRQEVRDEHKQTEGSPEVKGQIRRRQMEASRKGAQRRRALDDVPSATSIVTNPTHFAVAMRYVPGETDAPVVVAVGDGALAHRIVEIGGRAGVPVLHVPLLARALYFTAEIGQSIPEDLYAAVAVIEAHVQRLDHGLDAELPHVELPPSMRFDEHGYPLEGET
ncbi:flagellar biosynthesis protein FlhB [Rhodosalinus sp.]|uniref:EscU/YscU/HrcU family type III secretion system export apparatus switch protein n=1 Tax=Rhodosalinus sp. TaxID=2047741 RepID=UPI00397BEDF9